MSQDFVGSAETHMYGTVQVVIRVLNGQITKAWAQVYPTGASMPYTSKAIPTLSQESVGATSANVAAVSGATLTSAAWVKSLSSAMAAAHL
ncbi:MAG: FMN-binding protein [Actinomycetes bacterium]